MLIETALPPTNVHGFQRVNTFATQKEYINILTWNAPLQGTPIVAYRIYRDKHLIAVISSDEYLHFKDHNRKKGKTYTYYIVSVDQFGNLSAPAIVIIKGRE